jgi:protein-L-isoaspartate(D-aspartate) O-methyltransferase
MTAESEVQRFRSIYAERVTRSMGVNDARIAHAFASIPREAFLPPPPWVVISGGAATRSSDIADLYQNVLVSIDQKRGINNGEPSLHATWLATVNPRSGETAIHVGAGTGYYTAILAALVAPGGRIEAYEIHEKLAEQAAHNLARYRHVVVHAGSACDRDLPMADIIYVNAGVVAPDAAWLRVLKPGGRLIFPWQPASHWGTALLVMRVPEGLRVFPLMSVGFIPCSGGSRRATGGAPDEAGITRTRSVWLQADRVADGSATAVYEDVWFSSEEVGA